MQIWFLLYAAVALFHGSSVRCAFTDGESRAEFSAYEPSTVRHRSSGINQGAGQKVWCVAKPAADEVQLGKNIEYACSEGGVDCHSIQPGGPCYSPKCFVAHASYVMNLYYQKNSRNWWTCNFNNSGLVVFADPSFGSCKYMAQWYE